MRPLGDASPTRLRQFTRGSSVTRPPSTSALQRALTQASHLLPSQGPIGVFVHHNPLHAYEHLPFDDALRSASELLGFETYLEEAEYQHALAVGRIHLEDIEEVLDASGASLASALPFGLSERALRRGMLLQQVDHPDTAGTAFLHKLGHDEPVLLQACVKRLADYPRRSDPVPAPKRHRDVVLQVAYEDSDVALHEELQRLSAAFLDQGQALSAMPARELGFFAAVAAMYEAKTSPPRFALGVEQDFVAWAKTPPEEVLQQLMTALSVPEAEQESFLLAECLALPGWAGMFNRLEHHPQDLIHHPVPARLCDFLAVRLVFEHRALQRLCKRLGLPLAWTELRKLATRTAPRSLQRDAYLLFRLAQIARADATQVLSATDDHINSLFAAVLAFPRHERRRCLQSAYEGRYRKQVLDALAALRSRKPRVAPAVGARAADFVFCIDEREESLRRAIEEHPQVNGAYRTFGVAGFFGLAIDYQGLDDEQPAAYCPAVVQPDHEIREAPVGSDADRSQSRHRTRMKWNGLRRSIASGSRTMLGGAVQSLVLGPLAGVAVLGRVLAPRRALLAGNYVSGSLLPRPNTRLLATRETADPERSARGKRLGFDLQESVDRVHSTLVNIGLTTDFAPWVILLGHGSTSLNNPHESAHDCGACGGRQGGPNARLMAEMANRPDVREQLRSRGVVIGDDVWFVGALHDTASDSIKYYDLDRIDATKRESFDRVFATLETARKRNAKERVRRFLDVHPTISDADALRHVEERASHLAQPRPEYGHCTNSICIVGRRSLSQGLHFDRRSFLVSYDPSTDPDSAVLQRLLAAVGPVCAGINLEYYFSTVDNEHFGCGTKLPHNVTSLIGVMNGHQSDLRTGLPKQMVELHEPMRLLMCVEATEAALLLVASKTPGWRVLAENHWVQLVAVHPDTGEMSVFNGTTFDPYLPAPGFPAIVQHSPQHNAQGPHHLKPALVDAAHA